MKLFTMCLAVMFAAIFPFCVSAQSGDATTCQIYNNKAGEFLSFALSLGRDAARISDADMAKLESGFNGVDDWFSQAATGDGVEYAKYLRVKCLATYLNILVSRKEDKKVVELVKSRTPVVLSVNVSGVTCSSKSYRMESRPYTDSFGNIMFGEMQMVGDKQSESRVTAEDLARAVVTVFANGIISAVRTSDKEARMAFFLSGYSGNYFFTSPPVLPHFVAHTMLARAKRDALTETDAKAAMVYLWQQPRRTAAEMANSFSVDSVYLPVARDILLGLWQKDVPSGEVDRGLYAEALIMLLYDAKIPMETKVGLFAKNMAFFRSSLDWFSKNWGTELHRVVSSIDVKVAEAVLASSDQAVVSGFLDWVRAYAYTAEQKNPKMLYACYRYARDHKLKALAKELWEPLEKYKAYHPELVK